MTKTLIIAALACAAAFAQQNGTTLAGYKTIDICTLNQTTWRYSGVIAVWNEGAIDTAGFNLTDFIEYKVGKTFTPAFLVPVVHSGEIPAGTTQTTALTFPYSVDAVPLPGTIRNNASLTILNHSGSPGRPSGPNPKATYDGTIPPPAPVRRTNVPLGSANWNWGTKWS
ncbi:MAG: hypothetical protein LAQ30_05995, partial [Acidobacteriia bacterium]|nr:hypothetical protein [Terriglobia bacterium]